MAFLLFLILVVLVIVFSARISQLNGALRGVQETLKILLGRIAELETRLKVPERGTSPRPASSAQPGASADARQALPQAAQPAPPRTTANPIPVFSPPRPSRSKEEWEALIGGRLLNRIGALALIIGIGFFLKYAFDRNWITETTRVLIGAGAGVLLLAGAAFAFKKGFTVFSQGLVGAGIATLYLSVYASFSFYSLVSQPVAFILMASVTVIGFVQAFRYDSLAVALLGWLGGFMTPFLLSTGTPNEVGLFSYLGLLDAGLILVVIRKDPWMVLEPLALAATFVTYFAWYLDWYSSADLLPTAFFLTLFWCLFLIPDLYRLAQDNRTFSGLRRTVAQSNIVLYYFALYIAVNPTQHEWMGAVTFLLGLGYFGCLALFRRRVPPSGVVSAQYVTTAAALFVIGTAVQCERFVTVAWWSLEALLLIAAWTRWKLPYLRVAALLLFAITALKLAGTAGCFAAEPAALRFDERAIAFAALSFALGAGALLSGRTDSAGGARVSEWLHYAWILVLCTFLTVETNDYFRSLMLKAGSLDREVISFDRYLTLSLIWLAYALVLIRMGLKNSLTPLWLSGASILSLAGCVGGMRGLVFSPIATFSPVINLRVGALLMLIGGAWTVTGWLRKSEGALRWRGALEHWVGILSVLLILILLTGETRDYFERAIIRASRTPLTSDGPDEPGRLENLKQLSLSGVWLACSIGYLVAGIWRRRRPIRIISIVLFTVTIFKIFLYDLSSLDLLYRIFSFLGLGLVLLAVSFLYHRYRSAIFGKSGEA